MADGILGFFSPEAGQARRRRLQELGTGLEYYVPPELRPLVGLLGELNPVEGVGRAGQAAQGVMQPGADPLQRVEATGRMLSEMAGVAAPAAVAGRVGMPAAQAIQEGLLGFSAGAQDVGRAVANRLNQPGPMPTVYSNPVGLLGQNAKKEVIGTGYGQTDIRLTVPGVEGTLDYSVFDGRPKINMIEVPESARRKGNASKLLMALQAEFPNTEIDWGMLTEDGSRLYNATKFRDLPSEFADDFAKLDNARAALARKQSEFSEMQSRGINPSAAFFDEWNDLTDEVSGLERALEFESPTKRIIAQLLPTPRNEAEAMAKQILEMRAAGRAGDVTDEMMAAADPQYMFSNTPLPMDYESRMARAREMGFDPDKVRYHGSELDLSYLDPDMGAGERYRTGVFSTDNPDVADSYVSTSGGTIYPIITRRNDSGAVIDVSGANWNRIPSSAPARLSGSALEQEFPELFSDVNVTAYDVAPSLYDDLFGSGASTNALARQRRFEGDSNITFQNLVDRGPALKRYLGETKEMQRARELSASQPSEVRVDFYGNQIRAPFARFDPEFRHLRNLSAGLGALGLLAYPQEEY